MRHLFILTAFLTTTLTGQTLTPVVTSGNQWHTFPPGSNFQIQVSVTGTLPSQPVMCHWIDEFKNSIAGPFVVTNTPTTLTSPSTQPGWYGIIFTCANTGVSFAPQTAGWPSSVFGFAVIPNPPTGPVGHVAQEHCPFGMIQGEIGDLYFRHGSGARISGIHLKTKTWAQSTSTWFNEVLAIRQAGHTEMPLINNAPWDSSNSSAISSSQLTTIGSQFQAKLAADAHQCIYWQAGLEENAGSPYVTPYYFANLVAKVNRFHQVVNTTFPPAMQTSDMYKPVRFVYNTRSFDLPEFNLLFASNTFTQYDVLAQNPYKWNNFEMPDSWLASHIQFLRNGLDSHGNTHVALWFGELGLPARGHSNPTAFFGYPSTSVNLQGVTLDHYANYVIKTHMIGIARGVKRIYWYNYRNRYSNIVEAEAWFGMRSYVSGQPGFPYPGYVAYITMLKHLKTCRFIAERSPVPNMLVFEFQTENLTGRRLVVWYNSTQATTVPLNSLKPGLNSAAIQGIEDLYGRTVSAITGQNITVQSKPLFIRL